MFAVLPRRLHIGAGGRFVCRRPTKQDLAVAAKDKAFNKLGLSTDKDDGQGGTKPAASLDGGAGGGMSEDLPGEHVVLEKSKVRQSLPRRPACDHPRVLPLWSFSSLLVVVVFLPGGGAARCGRFPAVWRRCSVLPTPTPLAFRLSALPRRRYLGRSPAPG